MSKNLVTIPQAIAQRPFLTERWLQRIRAERRIPTYKARGRVLFDLDALDAFIESTRLEAAGPSTYGTGRRLHMTSARRAVASDAPTPHEAPPKAARKADNDGSASRS